MRQITHRRRQLSLFIRHRIPPASLDSMAFEEDGMGTEEALKIMRALASGTNPETGEALEPNSLYRKPQIIKALNRALAALAQEYRRERQKPANSGRYWSKDEDAKVCEEVRNGMDFHQIAKEHNRSVGSIVARLIKLGQIGAKPKAKAA